jgi:hypothetical protein
MRAANSRDQELVAPEKNGLPFTHAAIYIYGILISQPPGRRGPMEPQEVQENAEHAHHAGQKVVGLTTSIVAALLAMATLLGERSHTEEVLLRGEANDQWAYYQAKKIRSHIYEADAQVAKLSGEAGKEVATELVKKSAKYDADA